MKYVLNEPPLIISFIENKQRVKANFGHLGFQVESVDDLQLKMDIIKSTNLVIKEEMNINCCYAKQDKFWVNDPDGVQWQVYHFHEDVEFNDPYYDKKFTDSCCTVSDEIVKNNCGCKAEIVTQPYNNPTLKTACC